VTQSPDAIPFRVPGRTSPAELPYAYLNLRDHPRGQLQLEALVSAGFVPSVVIDEDSELAFAGRAGQFAELRQVAGFAEPEPTEQFCRRHGIAYRTVAHHNDEVTAELLRAAQVDLVVLGDTRVLRPHILALAPHGIVNVHPGYLPEVRGNNPYLWAVIHNLPQGVSVHLIDARVDRGPLLRTRPVPIPEGIGLPELVNLLNQECATLLVQAMRQIVDGTATLVPQPDDARLTFREARPEIRELVRTMLRERAAAVVARS
jgi:folate-dependent phosphoribosylglycinamide formyltransferase PurN